MKKSEILIAGVIAVAVCGMLTACGKEKEEIIEETKPTMYAVKKDLYGNDNDSEDATDEEATGQTDDVQHLVAETVEDNTEEQETVDDEMTEEKAVELCQKAYDALSSAEDMAEIASICDMELYYYFETGELVNDIEELTAYAREFLETESENIPLNFIVSSGVAVEDIKWDSATKLSRKKTTEWNKFIQSYMKEIFDGSPVEKYEFEEIWAVYVYEPEPDSSGEAVQNSNIVAGYDFENPLFLVVKHNDEWKADLMLPMIRQISDGLTPSSPEEMTESEDAETEEESNE